MRHVSKMIGKQTSKFPPLLRAGSLFQLFISATAFQLAWLFVLSPQLTRADVPSLSVLGFTATHAVQFSLHGQDGTNYDIEVSTNLTFWEPYLSLATTNGSAVFSHDPGGSPGPVFFRAALKTGGPTMEFQTAPLYSMQTIATPEDGGVADILLPDLRHITLTIPPGCVPESQAFTMTLITNIVGFPFAQGSFGAVMLDPEDYVLSGAASLQIDLPIGLDTREVASFGSSNDGSTFHLVMDRLDTDHVMIPISRFATYGSGLATPSEVGALVQTVRRKRGSGPGNCPEDPPHLSDFDRSLFPSSCNECFSSLVDRALAVQSHLRQIERCTIQKDAAQKILAARENSGTPENLSTIPDLLTDVCPFYETEIAPLWPEAQNNCALGLVLLEFMLGMERQIQLLGVTNNTCPFTLNDNLSFLCSSARECLFETSLCCDLGAHKGPKKISEALGIIRQFQLLGYPCFPEDLNDPDFKTVLTDCSINAWVGTMVFRQKGVVNYSTESNDRTTTVNEKVDLLFNGSGYSSYALQPPGEEGYVTIEAFGTGLIRINSTRTDTSSLTLSYPPCSGVYTTREQYDAVVMTNYFGATNDNVTGTYEFSFTIETNQTYELLVSQGDTSQLYADSVDSVRNYYTGSCPQHPTDSESTLTEKVLYQLPVFSYPFATVPVFQMPSPDTISGSADWQETNSYDAGVPVVLQTHVEWNFLRNTNVPTLGP